VGNTIPARHASGVREWRGDSQTAAKRWLRDRRRATCGLVVVGAFASHGALFARGAHQSVRVATVRRIGHARHHPYGVIARVRDSPVQI